MRRWRFCVGCSVATGLASLFSPELNSKYEPSDALFGPEMSGWNVKMVSISVIGWVDADEAGYLQVDGGRGVACFELNECYDGSRAGS
jgi:hypothetical protein